MSIRAAIDAEPSISLGRYNMEEAARAIAEATGESEDLLLKNLREAVAEKLIPVHQPGSKINNKPAIYREWWDEAYWNDLNHWLEISQRHLNFRFPKPPSPKNIIALRVEEIRSAAIDQFADPMSIPSGGKAALRDQLCVSNSKLFTKSTFDQAWKVARKENVVKMENIEQYILPK